MLILIQTFQLGPMLPEVQRPKTGRVVRFDNSNCNCVTQLQHEIHFRVII
jgi:hypothetical protein